MASLVNNNNIILGNKVRDLVSGLSGIAVAKVEYLNGCVQYGLKITVDDNKMPKTEFIDSQQLRKVDDGIVKELQIQPYKEGDLLKPIEKTGGEMGDDTPSGDYCV